MATTDIPKHIKADVQKLAYERTLETVNRICDTFGQNTDFLALTSSASMSAAFMMLYCAARIKHGPEITPQQLYKIWGETQQREFDNMVRGFDVAQEVVRSEDA